MHLRAGIKVRYSVLRALSAWLSCGMSVDTQMGLTAPSQRLREAQREKLVDMYLARTCVVRGTSDSPEHDRYVTYLVES